MPADFPRAAHDWLDHDAGPVVRPYAMTQGRVAPSGDQFDLVAFVVSAGPDAVPVPGLQPEHHAIVAAAWEPTSVVELASTLDLSIGVVRVLLGDPRVELFCHTGDVDRPMGVGVVDLTDLLDSVHEPGEGLELGPLVVHSGYGGLHIDRLGNSAHRNELPLRWPSSALDTSRHTRSGHALYDAKLRQGGV